MAISEPTSFKEMFQGMVPEKMGVIQGKVTSAAPLKIQVINDEKLELTGNIICLPRHLTDYAAKIDIQLGDGTIDSQTKKDGGHPHGSSGPHDGHATGSGMHMHPETEGAHVNFLQTFNISGATIKVYNALKVGEIVYLLSFNEGKKYYILDRVV
jgi:hypothetical protein